MVATTDNDVAPLIAGSTISALGLAAVVTLVTDMAIGAAPKGRAGAAAATAETSSELGGAIGLAMLGSIGAAIYRGGIADTAPAAARETIGGALAAGGAVVEPAREAFSSALTATASISAALLLLAAVSAVALRRRSAPPAVAASLPARP